MEVHPLYSAIWTIVGLCLFNFSVSLEENFDAFADDPSVLHKYNRLAEIEKQCKPFLSSASDLKPDDTRGYRLKKELPFYNGDWEQEIGGPPLMPFDDSDMSEDDSSLNTPLKLVNFHVTDVNPVRQWKNIISLIGFLSIGITRNSSFIWNWRKKFYIRPGMSVLSILFEGVYIENNKNGEERLLCMLGSSTLPNNKRTNDALDLAKPSLVLDDQILLVLRYPRTFNLTSRVIRGEMRSLNHRASSKYFDSVHLTSQLGPYTKYQFHPKIFKSRTCNPDLYLEELMEDGFNMFNGSDFCGKLRRISQSAFRAEPNWKFRGRSQYPHKLGPFQLEKEIKSVDQSYNNIWLVMQHINCEHETNDNDPSIARVSAVLRATPRTLRVNPSITRTGLSVMTLSAEGIWNQSSGQLCMVGCLGVVDSGLEGCNSHISIYFPRAFSIKQRSLIFGSISSASDEKGSYSPVVFESVLDYRQFTSEYLAYHTFSLSYNYSKIDRANAIRKRRQTSKFRTFFKHFLLKYPSIEDGEELLESLDSLSRELQLDVFAVANLSSSIFVDITLLSLVPLLGSYKPWWKNSYPILGAQAGVKEIQLLNVSMHLLFTREGFSFPKYYNNVSELFLEGLYDPLVGEAYLVGCRRIMLESSSLERGLDCLIEVKIEYPPVSAVWLINPTAKITITSQRKEDDPLYFSSISLRTLSLRYERHHNVLFRRNFEEILQNLILFMAIVFISGQFLHMKNNESLVPYVSRVMFGIQSLYVLQLICGTEILFKWKDSESFRKHPYNLNQHDPFFKVLGRIKKILLLAAYLITTNLSWKVLASRRRPQARGSSTTTSSIPSDKLVLLLTLILHNFGFLLLLVIDGMLIHPEKDRGTIGLNLQVVSIRMIELEGYIGVVQDLFLLPQIIGNFLWHNPVKSLSKGYYIGLTLVRLLLRVYDCIRDPVTNPVFEEVNFAEMNAVFLTKVGNIAVVVAMVVLSIIVHIQQNSMHRKVGTP